MAHNEALFGYLKAATDAIQKQSSSELINCLCLNHNKVILRILVMSEVGVRFVFDYSGAWYLEVVIGALV